MSAGIVPKTALHSSLANTSLPVINLNHGTMEGQ